MDYGGGRGITLPDDPTFTGLLSLIIPQRLH